MKRTTIFAEASILNRMRQIAKEEGVSFSELTRKALEQYVAERLRRAPLSFTAIGTSGRSDIAERHEELLWTRGDTKKKSKKKKKRRDG